MSRAPAQHEDAVKLACVSIQVIQNDVSVLYSVNTDYKFAELTHDDNLLTNSGHCQWLGPRLAPDSDKTDMTSMRTPSWWGSSESESESVMRLYSLASSKSLVSTSRVSVTLALPEESESAVSNQSEDPEADTKLQQIAVPVLPEHPCASKSSSGWGSQEATSLHRRHSSDSPDKFELLQELLRLRVGR